MKHTPVLTTLLLTALCVALIPGRSPGQCIMANPSFEVGGSGGLVFGGWNQFGVVAASTTADHGQRSAKVYGPDWGGWDVSAFWQAQDTTPGERWDIDLRVMNLGEAPLDGASIALVNVEWRDAADDLISYDTYTAADASAPLDTWLDFSVTSNPAPAGAVTARLLLGVLQGPGDVRPAVLYDTVTFFSAAYPTIDDLQWPDFPGGRVIEFSGYSWRVKGDGYYGPGPNSFSDDPDNVWVDVDQRLHLTVQRESHVWYSTEVVLEEALGYGDYIFTTVGRLDMLDPQVVLGLFIWQYGACWDPAYLWWNPYNEFDIEFSRWGDPGREIGQFVAQPYDWPGNMDRFDATFGEGEITSHAFRWLHDRVECRSWRGGPADESPATLIHSWTYAGPHIPRPEQPRVHLNLWKLEDDPAADQEAILDRFTFIPEGGSSAVDPTRLPEPIGPAGRLLPAVPNPFNPRTEIRYVLERDAIAEVAVYDPAGRRVRTLAGGFHPAGAHVVEWDGRDDAGAPQASGVYLYRLVTGDTVESRRMVLVR